MARSALNLEQRLQKQRNDLAAFLDEQRSQLAASPGEPWSKAQKRRARQRRTRQRREQSSEYSIPHDSPPAPPVKLIPSASVLAQRPQLSFLAEGRSGRG
jgi:hypothetical protein